MNTLPFFIDVKPSKFLLCFLIVVHGLSVASILLLKNPDLVNLYIKSLLIVITTISFNFSWKYYNKNIRLYLKAENQADIKIGDKKYSDLQVSGGSYISDIYMQLRFLDSTTEASWDISIFPDSIDAARQSQLRARLKIALA